MLFHLLVISFACPLRNDLFFCIDQKHCWNHFISWKIETLNLFLHHVESGKKSSSLLIKFLIFFLAPSPWSIEMPSTTNFLLFLYFSYLVFEVQAPFLHMEHTKLPKNQLILPYLCNFRVISLPLRFSTTKSGAGRGTTEGTWTAGFPSNLSLHFWQQSTNCNVGCITLTWTNCAWCFFRNFSNLLCLYVQKIEMHKS